MLYGNARRIDRTCVAAAAVVSLSLLGLSAALSGCSYDEPGHTKTVTKTTTDTPTAKTTTTETHEKDTRVYPPP
jgi:hypothetical protein